MADPLPCDIRWMIRRDLPEVREIESLSFPDPWSAENFRDVLRRRNCIGMVAESLTLPEGRTIAAFFIYELHRRFIRIINLAVHPDCRRRTVASQCIEKLKGKLSPARRHSITAEIHDKNLSAQLFFKSRSFRATQVLRGFYDLPSGGLADAYLFRYRDNTQDIPDGGEVWEKVLAEEDFG